ncbi:MAG TPA: TonB family protein [Candidatus Edwardsbacteria bacterium]|nr:TonB family protein [Candidatus Edwardsbacteria bacterium]
MNERLIITPLLWCALAGVGLADPRFASLKLTSEPDSATVILDWVESGKTPCVIDSMGKGKHLLIVSKRAYRNESYSFEVNDDESRIRLHAFLVPDTTKLDTTHATGTFECRPSGDRSRPGIYVPIVKFPELIEMVKPELPGPCGPITEGKVYVQMLVDTMGNIAKATIAKTSGDVALDQSAVKAAMKFRFKPAFDDEGHPARVWVM